MAPVDAHAPSGAIFTTVADGTEVNFNQYPSKDAVYLDGGPGPGAPASAAGLDDGTYVFQVTNPNGKDLLSTDLAACRQFTVAGGVITGVIGSCPHVTGVDADHNAVTVQLMPYLDTTNPGGVYKVWVTSLEDYLASCKKLGVSNGLAVVDCGTAPSNKHGFMPRHSKTDNFKVRDVPIVEIDTRFWSSSGQILDNRSVTWTDTVGASNVKHSYWAPELNVYHEAHVEGIEVGTHQITIEDQPGCKVQSVTANGRTRAGAQTVNVSIKSIDSDLTVWIDVDCA
ncbi:MAG TPA: hypothetical protein VFJ85_03775 [Acidimicrobiales bacterium]|nr:hypothetical protein [Acidimicrobiales bacterium]